MWHKRTVWTLPSLARSLVLWLAVAAALLGDSANGAEKPSVNSDDFYSGRRIVRIDIEINRDDWQELRVSHRVPVITKFTEDPYKYYKANVTIDGVLFKNVGVRKKGFFGSVVSTRPSLKIRFDRYKKKQTLHGMDQLTLNNNVQDSTEVNQYIAYWLFRRAGAVAPRCNFAVVTVNGERLGVYTNIESIRRPFLSRSFDGQKGRLYEGYAGDFTEDDASFMRVVNKNGNAKKGRKPLKRLRKTLLEPEVDLKAIENQVDLNAFITFWATEVLMGHWDSYSGNRNNYYIYYTNDTGRFYFIPWGTDGIFVDPGPLINQELPRSYKAVGGLCRRLWEIPSVRSAYQREMKRLLRDVWNEDEIKTEIARVRQMLAPHTTIAPDVAKLSMEKTHEFIETRRTELEAELDGEMPPWPEIKRKILPPDAPKMEITGTFDAALTNKPPEDPLKVGKASLKIRLAESGKELTFSNAGSYVESEQEDWIRPGYPHIHLVAQNEDEEPWHLHFYIDPIQLPKRRAQLDVDLFAVWAMLVKGDFKSTTSKRRLFNVRGTLKLDKIKTTDGGAAIGSFQLIAPAFVD